jgi:glycosyltransferase involved in cell wall biosynthesis
MRYVINRNATHLIGCSKGAGKFLYGEKTYQERGIMLNNGVDVSKFRFNPAVRDEIKDKLHIRDKFVIGHVGHLIAVKNQMFLLQIFKQVALNNRDSVLLLIGDGEDRDKLEEKVREYGLEGSVIFTGNVDDVHLYLNIMDVFVFPSLFEGLPLAVVEAQANGVPCIISDSIPDDVKLTDNIESLPLIESPKKWAEMICRKRRKSPEVYADYIANLGFDVHSSMRIINKIYAISE